MSISAEAHPLTAPSGISPSQITQNTLTARDGVELYYEIVGTGSKTIVLANGLGGRLYSWAPILRAFGGDYRFVTWDYRGLFESGAPERIRRLSIWDHAEDMHEILDEIGADTVVVTGWSMGVQVGLEFATLYPEITEGLFLLNGTYGHAFSAAFQPLIPIPYAPNLLHKLIEWVGPKETWIDYFGQITEKNLDYIVKLGIALSPASPNRREMQNALKQYVTDIFGTEFKNYLRLFQELDAHSVYHMLPHIDIPTLIISGALDILTPAYQSREMARRMPRARHRSFWLANHFSLLEYPRDVVSEFSGFLDYLQY